MLLVFVNEPFDKLDQKKVMERIHVPASYTIDSDSTMKRVDFIARVKDSLEGYKLSDRAQKAAARRQGVPSSHTRGAAGTSIAVVLIEPTGLYGAVQRRVSNELMRRKVRC